MNEPLTQEQYAQLLMLGSQNGEADQLMQQQMAMAKRLRAGGAPQMNGNSRVQVAPGILELLGGLAKEKVASGYDKSAQDSVKEQTLRKQQQHALMLQALMNRQQPDPVTNQSMGMGRPPMQPTQGFGIPTQGVRFPNQ